MADVKIAYGSSSALTITLASLSSDTSLLAGRESTEVDNTTNKYLDYLLAGKITTGTSPTASRQIEVWVVAMAEDSTYPDVFDGADSNESPTSRDILAACGRCVAVMSTDNTSNRTYWFGPVSVANAFGGSLPKKFVVFVVHNTGVALNSTSGNHALYVTPVFNTVA